MIGRFNVRRNKDLHTFKSAVITFIINFSHQEDRGVQAYWKISKKKTNLEWVQWMKAVPSKMTLDLPSSHPPPQPPLRITLRINRSSFIKCFNSNNNTSLPQIIRHPAILITMEIAPVLSIHNPTTNITYNNKIHPKRHSSKEVYPGETS